MTIELKTVKDEVFQDYKKSAMLIAFPSCDFKCDKENGAQACQNWELAKQDNIEVDVDCLIEDYLDNHFTHAIIFGGLEPFDTYDALITLLQEFRKRTKDDIVIYTGYTEEELVEKGYLDELKKYENIYLKVGRYHPNQEPHFDEVLGIKLASDNQYGIKL
jgi:pyruvate-formate lyase-activating enzyme